MGLVPPAALVFAALGSILFGFATPTEAAGCGAMGALLLSIAYRKLTLPKLQDAPKSTKNIDAISVKGERYAIKSTSGSGTGVFASLPTDNEDQKFEFLVVVIFDKDYVLKEILELNWEQFKTFRRMKPPENKWNLPITNEVKSVAKTIYLKK